jgi:hypothetical protein
LKAKKQEVRTGVSQKLCPFLDDKGILHVGGRLGNADLSFEEKHPILLPKGSAHHLSRLIICHVHEQTAQGGRNTVVAKLRFWVIAANSSVRSVLYHCVACRRMVRAESS